MITAALYVIASAFLAAVLRGFAGFGFVMAAVPLLGLALPPVQVVPLALLLQMEISAIGMREALRLCDWRSLRWLLPGMIVGTPLGILALTRLPVAGARLAIGTLIATGVAMLAGGVKLSGHPSRPTIFGVGMISGVMNGLAGMSGPPVVTYLLALPLRTGVVRATSIVFFMLTATVALVPMAAHGLIGGASFVWAILSWPALFAGARVGAWGFRRSQPATHRRVALILLALLAGGLALRGLTAG
ncbi:MAG: sulfite exporter TauE/SafE family protein [Rhodospirillales bacterium]|nr:sulfite exporter TauE/SafE family protein [Rhodospirillales bacterium]